MSWIGVDFDGTLSQYDGYAGPLEFGPPVPKMVERVKKWIDRGHEVKIFTARYADVEWRDRIVSALQDWCEEVGLPRLEVTNVKDLAMLELWDDRAVRVKMNTGEPCGYDED